MPAGRHRGQSCVVILGEKRSCQACHRALFGLRFTYEYLENESNVSVGFTPTAIFVAVEVEIDDPSEP